MEFVRWFTIVVVGFVIIWFCAESVCSFGIFLARIINKKKQIDFNLLVF